MRESSNPFAPGAGTQPPELTGRDMNLKQATVTLERIKSGRPTRSSLLVGLRGVGKTVLLNRMKAIADSMGFYSIMIESPEDSSLATLLAAPLRKILLKMDLTAKTKDKLHEAVGALRAFASVFDVKIGDISVNVKSMEGTADSGVLESDLIDLLEAVGEAAKESGSAVAIFIDELQYVKEKELGALLAGLHRVSQLNLPLVLFGAGLPQLAGLTGNAKSYAERLFDFQDVGKLGSVDAIKAIKDPIEDAKESIDKEALDQILIETEGYPYFLQEWGRHIWNTADASPISTKDVNDASGAVVDALDKAFFRVRFDRLTPLEKEYLRAMAELGYGSHRSGEIAELLKRPVEQVAPTRSNIIKKGMIYAPAHGDNDFTVPKFDEYMKRVMPKFVASTPKKRLR